MPTALLTVLETAINTAKAELNEEFNQELSLDDLLRQYKKRVGIEFELDLSGLRADYKDQRAKILTQILLEDGVTLQDNPEVSNFMVWCNSRLCSVGQTCTIYIEVQGVCKGERCLMAQHKTWRTS